MTLVASASLSYVAGDSILLEFTVTRNGAAVDISDMTLRFAIARRPGDTPVISQGDGATLTATDAEKGVFQAAIPDEETVSLSGDYRYEAEIENGSGDKATVARGFMTFEPAVIT